MPRHVHLALTLILLLVLAPLGGATCGIGCLASAVRPSTLAATAQQHCVRATACCHSSGPAICAAIQSSEPIALLISIGTNAPPAAPAVALPASAARSRYPRTLFTRNIDSSPPGQSLASTPTQLRI
jgi:hypothetical protein